MIHITDGKTDRILAVIDEDAFWGDKHTKSLKDTLETFDFTTFANKRFSEYLAERNRVIIPDEDGEYIEFIIENTRKFHSADGFFVEVYTSASYIELAKAKVIEPKTTPSWTAKQHAEMALSDTEWTVGTVDFAGSRTITIDSYTNPYSYLKQVANEFGLEVHFRVETDGQKVTRRYVDLVEHIGNWNGREVEFGKDLIGIERKEDFSNIVTALVGIGPEREDGTRLQVFVEDKNALARWGRNGKHLIEVYEPESADVNMTLERLRSLTEAELSKRIHSVVEYTADVADLEKVPGLEHEKFRLGDTIRIKDMAFIPPLYLEARVHTVERSIKRDGQKTVTLGDYIEYTEEDVFAIYKRLKAEIAKKVSMTEVMEVTYTKTEVDDKDASVYHDSTYYADNVSETAKQEAIQVSIADADAKLSAVRTELETSITQLSNQIQLKANQTTVDTLANRISSAESQLTIQSGQIATKVSQDGIISAINQTPESVKIQASKIQLQGAVTVLSDIVDDLGSITAGTIAGTEILSGPIGDQVRIKDGYVLSQLGDVSLGSALILKAYFQSGAMTIRENSFEYETTGTGDRRYIEFDVDGISYNDLRSTTKTPFSLYSNTDLTIESAGVLSIKNNVIRIGTGLSSINVASNATRLVYDTTYVRVASGFTDIFLDSVLAFKFDRANNNRIVSGAAILKFLTSSAQIQSRTSDDSAYGVFAASAFTVASTRDSKTNIEPTRFGLETILNTPVYDYKLRYEVENYGDENARIKTGLIWEEAPENLREDETIDLYSMIGIAWRAIQELAEEVNNIKASLGM